MNVVRNSYITCYIKSIWIDPYNIEEYNKNFSGKKENDKFYSAEISYNGLELIFNNKESMYIYIKLCIFFSKSDCLYTLISKINLEEVSKYDKQLEYLIAIPNVTIRDWKNNFVQYFKLFNKVFPITNFIKNNNEIDFNLDNTVLRLGVSEFFFHDKTSFKVKNIIFIGNLNKSKGILELLDFVDSFPNLMFHIIGEGELKKEILKANKKNIKFYGKKNRTELAQLLRHMDINISFSKSEGFSKTILETAASGVPSIIYNLFGSNEYIVNKKNGFLASDFNDFKIILEKLVSGEYNLRQISNNARLLADKNKWSNVINEWEKIIYEITN